MPTGLYLNLYDQRIYHPTKSAGVYGPTIANEFKFRECDFQNLQKRANSMPNKSQFLKEIKALNGLAKTQYETMSEATTKYYSKNIIPDTSSRANKIRLKDMVEITDKIISVLK
jgi:hypothetical protein